MSKPTVAIIGASEDRSKFGNKSARAHLRAGYEVFPINPKAEQIEGRPVYRSLSALPVETLDRIVLYVPPAVGLSLLEEIAATPHRELWLSPGTESDGLLERAAELGLTTIQGCTIVDLGLSPTAMDDADA